MNRVCWGGGGGWGEEGLGVRGGRMSVRPGKLEGGERDAHDPSAQANQLTYLPQGMLDSLLGV